MRPREGGNFGERVVRDLLNADGWLCLDGPARAPWDLLAFPGEPYLPVALEVKSSLDGRQGPGLSLDEVKFRSLALSRKIGWALVRVWYAKNGAKVAGKQRYRVVQVKLADLDGVPAAVRNALTMSLGREWRPARREG